MELDPNAASYTDDQIVGKVNSATANITRADSIEGTAASALDSDDISEGASNLYDTGVPPTDLADLDSTANTKLGNIEENATADQTGDEIVTAIDAGTSSITREDALDASSMDIVKTDPAGGEFKVKSIQRKSTGKLGAKYDDVAV